VIALGQARRQPILRNPAQTHRGIGRRIKKRENAAARPCLTWAAVNDNRTWPTHRAMHEHIAPIDDPIWKKWSLPPGHRCRCTRIALSEAQTRARRYPKASPGAEPDAGWEGDPTEDNENLVRILEARQASCLMTFAVKKTRARGLHCDEGAARDRMMSMATALDHDAPMPAPRALTLPLLAPGDAEGNWRLFMAALGKPSVSEAEIQAAFGERLFVSRKMFTDHKTGASKMDKRGRAPFMLYLAETILRPDEAWLGTSVFGDASLVLASRFVRGGELFGAVAVFKERRAGWEGWTAYNVPRPSYLQAKRSGVLIYCRPET
jgi:hypothetical protein